MKLSAIISRSVLKDYVDLYFILNRVQLENLLDLAEKKFPNFNRNLVLKSLTYFEDIIIEPIIYKHDQAVSFEVIKQFLERQVKEVMNKIVS